MTSLLSPSSLLSQKQIADHLQSNILRIRHGSAFGRSSGTLPEQLETRCQCYWCRADSLREVETPLFEGFCHGPGTWSSRPFLESAPDLLYRMVCWSGKQSIARPVSRR